MDETFIPVIVTFRNREGIPAHTDGPARSFEQGKHVRRNSLKVGHLEITSKASVQRRSGPPMIEEIDSWTDLVSIGEAAQDIPSGAEVDAEFVGDVPGILGVDAANNNDLV